MIPWGTFRTQVQSGLLTTPAPSAAAISSGTVASTVVDPSQMAIHCKWALAELSRHNAEQTSMFFQGDGLTSSFQISDDVVDSLERTARLLYFSNGRTYVLAPRRFDQITTFDRGDQQYEWWEWGGVIYMASPPPAGSSFTVNYFRSWRAPVNDDSILNIPMWMESPLALLLAAYYAETYTLEFSKIRQWNRRTDSGQPDDNPMFQQVDQYRKMAAEILARTVPQDRNMFYTSPGKSTGGR